MHKISVTLIAAIAISGCASFNERAMDSESVADIKGQTITYTARKKPDFAAVTAGSAVLGMVGAFASIGKGNSIIANNNVSDPAEKIATGLAEALGNAHGVRLVTPPAKVDADGVAQVAASVNGAATFVVDVQTINWSVVYFPSDWTHYKVIYTAKARVIDAQKKTVVAEGFCKHIPDNKVNAPTYDELMANGAAGLKSELNGIANECVSKIKTQMLSL